MKEQQRLLQAEIPSVDPTEDASRQPFEVFCARRRAAHSLAIQESKERREREHPPCHGDHDQPVQNADGQRYVPYAESGIAHG